jgi:hypothetical protein
LKTLLPRLLYLLATLFGLYQVWFALDWLSFDLGGHVASAVAFREGGLHGYDETFFLGSIHNLFYPPLEDLIVASLGSLCGDWALAFQLYLSVTWCAFLACLYWVFSPMNPGWAVTAGRLLSLYLVLAAKESTPYLGFSLFDMLRTGLSSQILGACFFLLLLRETLSQRRSIPMMVLSGLCLLTHIIMGAGALVLLTVEGLRSPTRRTILGLALALGTSALVWLPALAHSEVMSSARVIGEIRFEWLFLALIGCIASRAKSGTSWRFAAAAALFLPPVVAKWLAILNLPMPDFHYYRLLVVGLVIAIVACTEFASQQLPRPQLNYAGPLLLLAATLAVLEHFQPWLGRAARPDNSHHTLPANLPEFDASGGRVLVLEPRRAEASGLTSLLAVSNPDSAFATGLFWESVNENELLSSYLASLMKPSMVVDYWYAKNADCSEYTRILDAFIEDYNINTLVLPAESRVGRQRHYYRYCLGRTFKNARTTFFDLTLIDEFTADGHRFRVDVVSPRHDKPYRSNRLVELVPSSAAMPRILFPNEYPVQRFLERDYQRSPAELGPRLLPAPPEPIEVEHLAEGDYRIQLPEEPTWFTVKLTHLPGFELLDAAGDPLPLYANTPHMLGYGSGMVRLRYRRTPAMWLSYAITALSWLLLIGWWRREAGNDEGS